MAIYRDAPVTQYGHMTVLQSRMYLAIIFDLFSRRIVGWHIDKRLTIDSIYSAMIKAVKFQQPPQGLVFAAIVVRNIPVNALETYWKAFAHQRVMWRLLGRWGC